MDKRIVTAEEMTPITLVEVQHTQISKPNPSHSMLGPETCAECGARVIRPNAAGTRAWIVHKYDCSRSHASVEEAIRA